MTMGQFGDEKFVDLTLNDVPKDAKVLDPTQMFANPIEEIKSKLTPGQKMLLASGMLLLAFMGG